MQYVAPLGETQFLLHEVAPAARLAALPRYAHLDAELIDGVIAVAAKIAEEVASRVARPGRMAVSADRGRRE
jgi:hypothetical protein